MIYLMLFVNSIIDHYFVSESYTFVTQPYIYIVFLAFYSLFNCLLQYLNSQSFSALMVISVKVCKPVQKDFFD